MPKVKTNYAARKSLTLVQKNGKAYPMGSVEDASPVFEVVETATTNRPVPGHTTYPTLEDAQAVAMWLNDDDGSDEGEGSISPYNDIYDV